MTDLVVDFCSYQAAKYAVMNWHYSKSMPVSKIVKLGVWENDKFIGVVLFTMGSSKHLGDMFNLGMVQVCELARVACRNHNSPISKILAIAIKRLRIQCPGLRLVISYSDRVEGHHGGIYQASNWIYLGKQPSDIRCRRYKKGGKTYHWRTVSPILVRAGIPNTVDAAISLGYEVGEGILKHKYIYPLDKAMRRQVKHLAQPYPKKEDMRAIEGNNLVSNQTRRFDSDPSAIDTPERTE